MKTLRRFVAVAALWLIALPVLAQNLRDLYDKIEYRIPMRDGIHLQTEVYVPRNKPGKHPILLERTPYGAGPYGPDAFRDHFRGSTKFVESGYIFAFQDVRGLGQSEGRFANIRPQLIVAGRPHDIDESTDTYDTIDYLVRNVPDNNARVGIWGISYPGFYAAAGAIRSHPALKAASPQAPVADWFVGDDFHHHGALMLMDAMRFATFGETQPTGGLFSFTPTGTTDAYQSFLELGTLARITEKYFPATDGLWKDFVAHPDYDDFWQARSLPGKMEGVRCAVLSVGGWYDAEDCWGALQIYQGAERLNRGIANALVMGPWTHGMWSGADGSRLGDIDFGSNTSAYYKERIEFPFFDSFLRGDGKLRLPEAQVFETGTNRWRAFSAWPPKEADDASLYLQPGKGLDFTRPESAGLDAYISDPAAPVPYQKGTIVTRTVTYPVDDQRFAAARPDVLTYQSKPLTRDLTLAGPIVADLTLSADATDLDVVVKVIDVFPDEAPGGMGGYQRLVRGDVMRGRYRSSYSNPGPLVPGQPTRIAFELPDVLHTFPKGHRLMVQVQSSWFPLVDRNPQRYVNIYQARPEDFQKANVRVHYGGENASRLRVRVLGK